ncbi:MAG: aldolase/citrate lyase family protein [Spirochaetia bacterium]|nr:aldolase/citrate lyase family protein [Spirochaetia bacterium]
MNCKFERLRTKLGNLAEGGCLTALKTGTEAEDMSFEDIRILKALSRDILPIYVKIGGPEARNDIREMYAIGVDGIIAPMIESPYALKKFVETLHDILGPISFEKIQKAINIETILAVDNLEAIFSIPEATYINQITAARSDLSSSMDTNADDEGVHSACLKIVDRARNIGFRTSVGGAIHPGNVNKIVKEIMPDLLNTRNMVMDTAYLMDSPPGTVSKCLEFEAELYTYLSDMPGERQKSYEKRVQTIHNRMNNEAVSAHS